jgi:hypothetical protein
MLRATDITVIRKVAELLRISLKGQPNQIRVTKLVIQIQNVDDVSVCKEIAEQIKQILGIPGAPSPPPPSLLQGTYFFSIGLLSR